MYFNIGCGGPSKSLTEIVPVSSIWPVSKAKQFEKNYWIVINRWQNSALYLLNIFKFDPFNNNCLDEVSDS